MMNKAIILLVLSALAAFAYTVAGDGVLCYRPSKCDRDSDCRKAPVWYKNTDTYMCLDHRCVKVDRVGRSLGQGCHIGGGLTSNTYFYCEEGYCSGSGSGSYGLCKATSGRGCKAPESDVDLWECEYGKDTEKGECLGSLTVEIDAECDDDKQIRCATGVCKDKKCVAKAEGEGCDSTQECGPDRYCKMDSATGERKCAARKNLGAECTSSEECPFRTDCFEEKCMQYYSQQTGQNCTQDAHCDVSQDLFCDRRRVELDSNERVNKCAKFEHKKCQRDIECPVGSCVCESVTSKASDVPTPKCNLDEPLSYKKLQKDVHVCMRDNKCLTSYCSACHKKYVEMRCDNYGRDLDAITDETVTFDCKAKTANQTSCMVLRSAGLASFKAGMLPLFAAILAVVAALL